MEFSRQNLPKSFPFTLRTAHCGGGPTNCRPGHELQSHESASCFLRPLPHPKAQRSLGSDPPRKGLPLASGTPVQPRQPPQQP